MVPPARSLRWLCAWALLTALPAQAQTVRGAVQDAAKRPVAGVVVSLLDSTSAVIGRALSDERGEFRVVSQRPGTMRVRAQRIGFAATVTEPFVLGIGATVTPTVTLEGAQVQLATVRVTANTKCGRADPSDASLYDVWEQAHTSLAASLLGAGTRGLTTSIMNVQRTLDPGGKLLDQQLGMRSGNMTQPWASLPIDTLRKRGYVWIDKDDALTYNAPGLDGFVSPLFLEDHCFKLVASKDTNEIGVAFEPAPQRAKASDIRGTFWVQRATAELRRADFSFTMPQGVPTPPVPGGGTMRFARIPNGAVIIETWELRMPLTSKEQFGGTTKTRVDQLQSSGGMVVAIRRGADTLFKRPLVTVIGVVRDSVSNKPLSGASVSLSGTTNTTRSGPDGKFQLTDVLPGQYTLAVATPALEAMRASAGSSVVVRDSLAPLVVKVPTEAQVAQSLCGANFSLGKGVGAIVGAVTRSGSTEGIADIPVVADWTERSTANLQSLTQGQGKRLQTKTDATGGYRLCGVPVEAQVTVRAFPKTGRAQVQQLTLAPAQRFATVALHVDVALAAASTFRGVVVADSGAPIAGADVSVSGSDRTARTDEKGAFRIDEVSAGTHEITVRKLGFSPLNTTLTFAPNDEEERRVVLNKLTVLDSVEIIANKAPLRMVEFEENRKVGLGWFLDRATLEKLDGQVTRSALINARNMVFAGGRYPISTHSGMVVKEQDDGSCKSPNALTPPLAEKAGGMICACFPVVFMDGVVRSAGNPTEPFDLNTVAVHQLEAVEWYPSPASLPVQFNRNGAQCGALVLHTRMDPGTKKKPGTAP